VRGLIEDNKKTGGSDGESNSLEKSKETPSAVRSERVREREREKGGPK